MRPLLKVRAGRAAAAIAISPSIADDARATIGQVTPVHTVMNGVDLQRFTPTGPSLPLDSVEGAVQPPDGTIRLGLVATYARWKGHAVFFEMLSHLASSLPWHAYVVGGPVYATSGSQYTRADLLHQAYAAGIADRVTFIDMLADVPAAIRSLDIVVHASTAAEPFGLAIAEAMACGRPVVTCGHGGALDIARLGPGVIATAPSDAMAMAIVVGELITSQTRRLELGRAARTTAERHLSRQRMIEEIVKVYEASSAPRDRQSVP